MSESTLLPAGPGYHTLGPRLDGPDPDTDDNHEYIKGGIETVSPCPALNALANHGYFPRDGRNISLEETKRVFTEVLHMSTGLAWLLSLPARDFLKPDGTYDLTDLREHNKIEHDFSYTRLNHSTGDNFSFQPSMLRTIIEVDARGGAVDLRSIARMYNRRHREEREKGTPRPTWRLFFVGLSQTVSFMSTSGLGNRLEKEVLWEFFGEEKWPDVILQNTKTRTLLGQLWRMAVVWFWVVFGGE